ncbi:MAG: hypothetical protein WCO63_02720 [Bacteroidota bacterium]
MNSITKQLLPFLFLVIIQSGLYAQAVVTRLDTLSKCPDNFIMPIHIEHFLGVASMSLKINYDTTNLVYNGSQNQNPALGGNFLMNGVNQQVILSWFSLNGSTLDSGVLVELKFFYKNNTNTTLDWDDTVPGNCVYTDIIGTELPAVFVNGYIQGLMKAPLPLTPANNSQGLPTVVDLHWAGSGCTPLYTINVATDSLFNNIFITAPGVFGTSFSAQGLNMETTYYWRLLATNAIFATTWSDTFHFKTQADGINALNQHKFMDIGLAPNPCNDRTTIKFSGPCNCKLKLRMVNILGKVLWQEDMFMPVEGQLNFEFITEDYPSGLYRIISEKLNSDQYTIKTSSLIIQH